MADGAVSIEIEDECGGLPAGPTDELFQKLCCGPTEIAEKLEKQGKYPLLYGKKISGSVDVTIGGECRSF